MVSQTKYNAVNWLQMTYGKSYEPKKHLCRLLEFNKMNSFDDLERVRSSTEFERAMSKFISYNPEIKNKPILKICEPRAKEECKGQTKGCLCHFD